ncbi:YlbF family regulator [Bacillus andreraoultii]|uniref:YlbF family regulator n=1 Tax=Bacillus andreraoultii TaxID=1499685 RepID=UPI00053A1926|nr:YlbF family regulator [Bacillus andreraoultii]
MAGNIFETANTLEQVIRDSAEFTELRLHYANLYADQEAKKLFDDFRNVQMNLQQKQMTGQPISQEEVMQAQQMVSVIGQNEKIARLMEAEQRMSGVIAEINKIVMRPLEELYNQQ